MKRITVIAIVIAGLLIAAFTTYRWYRGNPQPPAFSLVGEWQVDSLIVPGAHDSTHHHTATDTLSAGSPRPVYTFGKDSIYHYRSANDSISAKYYVTGSQLNMVERTGLASYPLTIVSDSLVRFTRSDSTVTVLRRR